MMVVLKFSAFIMTNFFRREFYYSPCWFRILTNKILILASKVLCTKTVIKHDISVFWVLLYYINWINGYLWEKKIGRRSSLFDCISSLIDYLAQLFVYIWNHSVLVLFQICRLAGSTLSAWRYLTSICVFTIDDSILH